MKLAIEFMDLCEERICNKHMFNFTNYGDKIGIQVYTNSMYFEKIINKKTLIKHENCLNYLLDKTIDEIRTEITVKIAQHYTKQITLKEINHND